LFTYRFVSIHGQALDFEPPSQKDSLPAQTVPLAKDLGSLGDFPLWSKVEAALAGPAYAADLDVENPFRVQVDIELSGPGGTTTTVPAFFEGDGAGGLGGSLWKFRFSPDQVGDWHFVSRSQHPLLDGFSGSFSVTESDSCQPYRPGDLPDFACVGRLQRSNGPYLRFASGLYWLKGGADEPEDFLAPGKTAGFGAQEQAVDFLAEQGANSIYILLSNIDGDESNVWPWLGATPGDAKRNSDRFDLKKLARWEQIFDYIQDKGIVLHLVFEDDSAWTGFDRELFYREMVARFSHHNGLIWNLAEEYNENYTPEQVQQFAQRLRELDPYDHPITVHHGNETSHWRPFLGDRTFDLTSLQTEPIPQNSAAVSWREEVRASGWDIPISFDETGQLKSSERSLARHILWSVYLGGANYEIFTELQSGYPEFTGHFEDIQRARAYLEALPFWQMRSENDVLPGGSGYAFAKQGALIVAYLPEGGSFEMDLTRWTGLYETEWFNPRSGERRAGETYEGGGRLRLQAPDDQDWVVKLRNECFITPVQPSLSFFREHPVDIYAVGTAQLYLPFMMHC